MATMLTATRNTKARRIVMLFGTYMAKLGRHDINEIRMRLFHSIYAASRVRADRWRNAILVHAGTLGNIEQQD
jgi:hypothetical protein